MGDKLRLGIYILLLGMFFLTACLEQKEEAPPPEEGSIIVEAKSIKFQPEEAVLEKGSTVTWVNRDPFAHTVTFSDFDERLERGGSVKRSFSEPGRYEYTCRIHPSMKGVIIVEETESY